MASIEVLIAEAEAEWLARWTEGPSDLAIQPLGSGEPAPDAVLLDHTGVERRLSEFWRDGPALLLFWRHFGCNCGLGRAERLRNESTRYTEAGLNPVIIAAGEPERAEAYRADQDLPCPVLCDPGYEVYRAYGVGEWALERVLYDTALEYVRDPHGMGVRLQRERQGTGHPLVDDPWRAMADFVVGTNGVIRLGYSSQHCLDYPPAEVLITAAALATAGAASTVTSR